MSEQEHPVVFLSYARTNENHVQKIIEFASTLRKDGIDAKIDEWDLKVGNDLYYFMENSIKKEADKVLLILNKEFVEKADERKAGVGAETQIMSKEVYDDVKQERIIPIVWECDETGNPYLPIFLKSRFYIDLSSNEKFGENYKKLLRTLYNKPKNPKEELGEMPEWLNDTNKYYPKTNEVVKRFNYIIDHQSDKIDQVMEEFYENYYEYLKSFPIELNSKDKDSVVTEIYDNLEDYQLLKKDFEKFADLLTKKGKYHDIDYNIIVEFLTNVHSLTNRQNNNIYEVCKFEFILKELFLYLIAYGLKNKNYQMIEELLHSPYYLTDEYYQQKSTQHFVELDMRDIIDLNNYMDYYFKKIDKMNYCTPIGELLIRRIPHNLIKEYLVDADLLSCYVSFLNKEKYNNEFWFPYTYAYKGRGNTFEMFRRLTSRRYFEKVKKIFDVETIEEFKIKVKSTNDSYLGQRKMKLNECFDYVHPIEDYIDLDEIGNEK